MDQQLKILIDDKKRERRRGEIKIKRGVRQMFPGQIERFYERELNKLVSTLIRLTREIVYPSLPSIVEEAGFNRPKADSSLWSGVKRIFNKDDFSDIIAETLKSMRIGFEGEITDQEMVSLTEQVADRTSDFNRKEVTKVLKSMVGVNVFFDEPWLSQELNAFVKSNVDLINTIPERYFNEIEEITFRGARQGIRHEEIRKEIIGKYGKTRNIAKRIARDQVNKLNGQLTKLRQTSVGVAKYTWVTVGDERVRGNPNGIYPSARPSHFSRNGNIYEWENPPSGGHPGEPIQCRCWAEPVLEDLI